jgi:glucan phosphorylase
VRPTTAPGNGSPIGGLKVITEHGWWAEAYTPEVGWALGDGQEHDDDAAEAEELYSLLEQEVIPAFYTRDHAPAAAPLEAAQFLWQR